MIFDYDYIYMTQYSVLIMTIMTLLINELQEVEETETRVREKEARMQELLEKILKEMEKSSPGNGEKEEVVEHGRNST